MPRARSTLGYARGLAEPFALALSLSRLPRTLERSRIPIGSAHAMLDEAVAQTGHARLGLDAGRAATLGDGGALDYAMHSAATLRAALETLARFVRVVNGELGVRIESSGQSARLLFDSLGAMPDVAEDFLLAAIYTVHVRVLVPRAALREVRFVRKARARDESELREVFGVPVRFAADARGFVLDGAALDAKLPSADPKLHAILLRQLERELRELPEVLTFKEKVQKVMEAQEPLHASTLKVVAQAVQMSPRTLSRRLHEEGTSFAEIVDDLRRRRAGEALREPGVRIDELARSLGFSSGTAFHRAFKRWTGVTPREYGRRAR